MSILESVSHRSEPSAPRDPYRAEGFENRAAYLRDLAARFGLPLATVLLAASMLGPDEDFDGLVTTLEDCDLDGL